jgi:hypothetical protein
MDEYIALDVTRGNIEYMWNKDEWYMNKNTWLELNLARPLSIWEIGIISGPRNERRCGNLNVAYMPTLSASRHHHYGGNDKGVMLFRFTLHSNWLFKC